MRREGENAADVVIHDVDGDTLLDLLLKDGEDFVPDATGADDEELKKDVMFGGVEVGDELVEIGFAVGKVGGLVVLGEGDLVGFADVAGLESGDGVFLFEFCEGGIFGIENLKLFADSVGLLTERLVFAVAGKDDEKKRTDDREADDDESPEEAHFEIVVVIDDVESDGEREKDGENSDREEMTIEEKV